MSLFTIKRFINYLTTGMSCLVTMETISSINFALGQLKTERDTMYCVPLHNEALYQKSNHRHVLFVKHRGHFIDKFCISAIEE